MHHERRQPRHTGGVEEVEQHPAATGLAVDGRQGRHTGEIEQDKDHEHADISSAARDLGLGDALLRL